MERGKVKVGGGGLTNEIFEYEVFISLAEPGGFGNCNTFTHFPISVAKFQQRRPHGGLYLRYAFKELHGLLMKIRNENKTERKYRWTYGGCEISDIRALFSALTHRPRFDIGNEFWEAPQTHRSERRECVF